MEIVFPEISIFPLLQNKCAENCIACLVEAMEFLQVVGAALSQHGVSHT